MTSAQAVELCCTNEGLCGSVVAVGLADLWHHENALGAPSTTPGVGAGAWREHPGRLSPGGGRGLTSE